MLDVHYAPRTPALRVHSVEDLAKVSWPANAALLVLGPAALPDLPAALHLVELPEPKAAGQRLYSILHECDALDLDVIIIVMPPDQPEWSTIRDRLARAARPVTG
jgi:L-threonylcarbamoyladenylate synthase